MVYTKQTWADSDPTKPLSAARLNYIEQGIADAHALNSPSAIVINVEDEGAVGNDVADDRAAIQSAINKAQNVANLGLPATVQLMRRHRIGSPGLVISNGGSTLKGHGAPGGSILSHTSGYNGGYLLTVNSTGRTNEKQAADNTWTPNNDSSGVILRDFTVSGRDRTNVKHGIRVTRADDMRMFNIEVNYCRGIGLQLGDVDATVANEVGIIRESHFHNIRIMFCGDSQPVPAMQIGHSANGSGDGTNQLYFLNLDLVYNYGGLHIVNHHATEIVRRIQITHMQNHGISHGGTVGNLTDYDLIRIEGNVHSVTIDTLITNSSGANHAVVRTMKSAVTNAGPRTVRLNGLSCSSADGDVCVFDSVTDFQVTNATPSLSNVVGAFVRVPTGAGVSSYLITGTQTNTTDNSSKFNINSAFTSRGTIIWPPWSMPGGGTSNANPYMALIVDDSSGQYPLRSDVTSDTTKPVICVGDSNPYTSGMGYISSKDVWLDPQ